MKSNPGKFHPDPIENDEALSHVHTGRFRRLESPFSATVAEFGDSHKLSPFPAIIVASVDRALNFPNQVEERSPNKNNNHNMSNDIRSVPDLKRIIVTC